MGSKTVNSSTSANADDLWLKIAESTEKTSEKLCNVAERVEGLSTEFVKMQKDVNEKLDKLEGRLTNVERRSCVLL